MMDYVTWTMLVCLAAAMFPSPACCQKRMSDDKDAYVNEAVQIVNTIFHKYQAKVPPAMKLLLDLDVKLVHLARLDIVGQVLETSMDVSVEWMDSRLVWNPRNVRELKVEKKDIWHPDVSVVNAVDKPVEVGDAFFVVRSNGHISWSRRLKIVTSCATNTSSLIQNCDIRIGSSAALDTSFIQFNPNNTAFNVNDGLTSHDWDVLSSERIYQEDPPQVVCSIELQKTAECCASTGASRTQEPESQSGAVLTCYSVLMLLAVSVCGTILAQV